MGVINVSVPLLCLTATQKRVDSMSSCDECEVAEETSVAQGPISTGCFVFRPPPLPQFHPRRPVSASSYCYSISDSDSQSDSGRGHGGQSSPVTIHRSLFTFRGYQSDGSPVALHSLPRFLPPIGVFWDIENCQASNYVEVCCWYLPGLCGCLPVWEHSCESINVNVKLLCMHIHACVQTYKYNILHCNCGVFLL